MCGRYTLVATADDISARFSVEVPPSYQPSYNAAPSQLLPVITAESPGGLSTFYWGLAPSLSKNKVVSERIINVRSEQIQEKPVLLKALRNRRCIVPADGFYEWRRLGKKTSTPYRIVRKDRGLFSFAGTWEEYEDVNGAAFHTFSILTTASNELVMPIHDRMPVILSKSTEKIWLTRDIKDDEFMELLQPVASDQIEAYTVSARVNALENNDRLLIKPAPPQDQHGNLTLFD